MVEYPELVAGTGRLDTALMMAAKGDAMAKIGGEGVYACVLPRMDRVVVLKAEDGAHRATQAALFTLLEKYKLVTGDVLDAIRPLCLPVLKNWRGLETGEIHV
jgi:L-asparaginase II